MTKEKPKNLYKYRSINIHTLNLILANEAYFSIPIEFNDPFDCNISPQIDYTWQKEFIDALRRDNNFTEKDYQDFIKDPEGKMEYGWKATIDNIRNKMRIFCFSEVNNSVLMFSHYADKHKGICLEFVISKDPFFDLLDYVRYQDKTPVFHAFNKNINEIHKELEVIELLTKSRTWCYEREWRILKKDPAPINKFHTGTLSAIIFGCQTSYSNKLLIKNIIAKRETPIQLKEAVKKRKSFELEIIPCQL
jgi:hypothetical protein